MGSICGLPVAIPSTGRGICSGTLKYEEYLSARGSNGASSGICCPREKCRNFGNRGSLSSGLGYGDRPGACEMYSWKKVGEEGVLDQQELFLETSAEWSSSEASGEAGQDTLSVVE